MHLTLHRYMPDPKDMDIHMRLGTPIAEIMVSENRSGLLMRVTFGSGSETNLMLPWVKISHFASKELLESGIEIVRLKRVSIAEPLVDMGCRLHFCCMQGTSLQGWITCPAGLSDVVRGMVACD